MGILDYDIELAKQAIKRTPGLLNEYIGRLNSTLQDKFAINEMDQKRSMRGLDAMAGGDLKVSKQKLDNAIAQKMVNVGLDMNPGAVGQIVWHGSPHKFNKFDMSKIGTGEGAQAYGHGLYMAESPEIAGWYQKQLGKFYDEMATPEGVMPLSLAMEKYHPEGKGAAKVAEMFRKKLDVDSFNKAVDEVYLPAMRSKFPESEWGKFKPQAGNMYKVDIPDEAVARFLDWDKPLSQQAPEVQAALGDIAATKAAVINADTARINSLSPDRLNHPVIGKLARRIVDPMEIRGNQLLDAIRESQASARVSGHSASFQGLEPPTTNMVPNMSSPDVFNDATVSRYLQDKGIPGIRYLDGGSRGAGQGSSNFVLFDDQMPRILEINGQATGLQPWAKGEWRGLLGE